MEIAPDLQFMHYTVAEALRETHWYELREWTSTGPGAGR